MVNGRMVARRPAARGAGRWRWAVGTVRCARGPTAEQPERPRDGWQQAAGPGSGSRVVAVDEPQVALQSV